MYEHLVRTAVTEIDMRKRQQLFIIIDMIHNLATQELTRISSGSLAEGIDLPGSDIDIMFVFRDVDVIQDERHIKHPVKRNTFVIETDNDHPGFTRLRLLTKGYVKINCKACEYFEETTKGLSLSSTKFVCNMSKMFPGMKISPHGPCPSDKDRDLDLAFCFRSKYLPYNTISWASRYRQQWPPNSTIDKKKKIWLLVSTNWTE
ncbi:Hypothetical predicted protein [Mytilus galloprovincialis]|uniref:Uncharacterized protein n=1 Tax=Mytilus galloprovincialis TaxID=29158 RepID=A0A8B6EI64_MYTGA|nr:Hypothetical predicted protein [Mytilus galloprovincialis]